MALHDDGCICTPCLQRLRETMARITLRFEIEASFYHWDLCPGGRWAGHDPTLPQIEVSGWHSWFARQDRPRRELILAKCEIVFEAEELLRR
jgi:hypothetical protein